MHSTRRHRLRLDLGRGLSARSSKGSGAPTRRLTLLAVPFALFAALLLVPVAQAAPKSVVSFFGNPTFSSGTIGGQFNAPRGLAVSQAGIGGASAGDIYVVDGSNNRIQQFSASGSFIRAFGQDVIQAGKPNDVSTTAFEVCDTTAGNLAADCKQGIASVSPAPGGEMSSPQGIAIDQSTGDLYVTDGSFLRVQEFDATGHFIRAFGQDVIQAGKPNDVSTTAFEVCDTTAPTANAAADCKTGTTGGAGGAFASTFNGYPAVVPTGPANAGDVLVADPGNRRVQEFDSSGAFVRTFGYDVAGPGAGADNTGTGFEICTQAVADSANCKAAAASGSAIGQLGTGANRVAANSNGAIFTVEQSANFRIQRFAPVGSSLDPSIFAAPTFAASTVSTTPTDIAVNSSSNRVLVTRATPAGATPACPSGAASSSERRVLEFDPTGNLADTHLACAGINANVLGLATRDSTGAIYVTSTTGAPRVFVIGAPVNPTAALDATPVDPISATSATLHGVVDPTGLATGYHFEYSTDNFATLTKVPAADADAGPTGSANPVTQTATGLEPNTSYKVRLVAVKPFNAGSATSAAASFSTPAGPPRVDPLWPSDITADSARLGARIDAEHSPTTYYVQYSTDPSFASPSSFPASEDAGAGAGTDFAVFSQGVTGLAPDTTYYYRVVATNAPGGTAAGAAHSFTTLAAAAPASPDRGYEKVSPEDKNGYKLFPWGFHSTVSSGDRVIFDANGALPGSNAGSLTPLLASRDSQDGWSSRAIDSPSSGGIFPLIFSLSSDLLHEVVSTTAPLAPGAGAGPSLYLRDNATATGSYTPLLPAPVPAGLPDDPTLGATSSDFTAFLYSSPAPQTADPVSGPENTYLFKDGQATLVGLLPDSACGLPPCVPSNGTAPGGGSSAFGTAEDSLSRDGSRAFFHAIPAGSQHDPGEGQIYVREHLDTPSAADDTTVPVSASQKTNGAGPGGTDPAGPLAAVYLAAEAEHGSDVLFTSCEQLTNDSTAEKNNGNVACNAASTPPDESDLYLYDIGSGELTDLTTADPSGGGFLGVVGASDDLSRVYFVARGALDAGATPGQPNLYLYDGGDVRFIATLDDSQPSSGGEFNGVFVDSDDWDVPPGGRVPSSRVTPSGAGALFTSRARLTPYDNSSPNCYVGRCAETYLYDADADQLTCVSCAPGQAGASGDATLVDKFGAPIMNDPLSGNLTPDGSRAFFETPTALLPSDSNHAVDVYAWHEGRLELISPGVADTDAHFADATPSGSDVFFTTNQPLVGSDRDSLGDVYDARVGGGFDDDQTQPPCHEDDCQGPLSGSPADLHPGSGGAGAGNVREGRQKQKKHHKKKHHKKVGRHAKHNKRGGK